MSGDSALYPEFAAQRVTQADKIVCTPPTASINDTARLIDGEIGRAGYHSLTMSFKNISFEGRQRVPFVHCSQLMGRNV